MSESASEAAAVAGGSKQAVSSGPEDWGWVDRDIWTERMLAALGNGVRGGKWFSLIDKVYRPSTLRSAWQDVLRNRGAAGVDRVSVERFAGQLERYLAELDIPPMRGQRSGRWEATVPAHGRPAFRAMGGQ